MIVYMVDWMEGDGIVSLGWCDMSVTGSFHFWYKPITSPLLPTRSNLNAFSSSPHSEWELVEVRRAFLSKGISF